MELKNLFQNDDRAVSPVIGVILMVAITVILAAVIGTFVLGLGDDIQTEVNAGVSVDQNSETGNITVTWTSQGNADGVGTVGLGMDTDGNVTSVGQIIDINEDSINVNITEGQSISVVAFQDGDNTANAEQTTVVRSITANFDINGA